MTTRRDHLQRAARALGGDPWAVTSEALLAWVGVQPWARETRRSVYASLRSFYRWGVRAGRCPSSPAEDLPKVRAADACPRPTPERVYRHAERVADERERLILQLAAQTGLRRAEIARVHRTDLLDDLVGRSLVVHGKGGRDRIVPLPGPLAIAVERACIAGGGWAFPGRDHGHLSAQRVGIIASRLLPEGWTLHTLRHRFATTAYAAERDLIAVQRLLGHASVATTQRYVAPPDDALRRAVTAAA
jgi:integrase